MGIMFLLLFAQPLQETDSLILGGDSSNDEQEPVLEVLLESFAAPVFQETNH